MPGLPVKRHTANRDDDGLKSVFHALDLLEVFLSHGPEISLTDLAAHAKIDKANAQRLLSALENRGYVLRSTPGRKYRLGVRPFELGSQFQSQLDIRRAALPELTSMAQETGQAGFLCVADGDFALCLERIEGRYYNRIFALRLGERQPLHCGGAPRALLSGRSHAEILAYAARTGIPKLTPQTIGDAQSLIEDANQTRSHGYAVSNEDVSAGIAAIGAPVRDHRQRVIAAISVSGIAATYTRDRVRELSSVVVKAAERISRQMGYVNK